jgi:type IV pilus assembly protein PilM
MRLPGLQRYLAQNLGYELAKVDSFRGLTGSGIVDAPAFKENLLAFGVCYGLCLQGLNMGRLGTNLLPREIMQYRMIRAKKPWAVAAAAVLLLGCGASYFRHWSALETVSLDKTPGSTNSFFLAKNDADTFIAQGGQWRTQFDEAKTAFAKTDEVGKSFLQNVQGRARWLEFLKAVNLCLPRDEGTERVKEIAKRNEIKIDSFESQWVEDLSSWYAMAIRPDAGATTTPGMPGMPGADPMGGMPMQDPNAPPPMDGDQPAEGTPAEPVDKGPTGPGWVFKVRAHHYHNEDQQNQGTNYVRNTLLKNLKLDDVSVPAKDPGKELPTKFPVKKLGIEYPLLIGRPIPVDYTLPPPADGGDEDDLPGIIGVEPAVAAKKAVNQRRLNFTVEFCWRPHQTTEKPKTDIADNGSPPAAN